MLRCGAGWHPAADWQSALVVAEFLPLRLAHASSPAQSGPAVFNCRPSGSILMTRSLIFRFTSASPANPGRTRFRSKVMRKISIWRLYRSNQFRLLKWWRRSEWAGKPGALCVFGCQLVILALSAPFEGAGGSVGGRVATARIPKPGIPHPEFLVESIVIRNEARNGLGTRF